VTEVGAGDPLRTAVRSVLSASARRSLRRTANRLRYLGWRRYCPLCRSHLRRFLAHGAVRREDAVCPVCQSRERHRLAYLYLEEHPEILADGATILHIAPEVEVARFLRRRPRSFYVSGTNGTGAMVHLDAERLPFRSATVDFLYCSHVLNMVRDDTAVMAEFARVLSPRGWALLQVPVSESGTVDLVDEGPEERQRAFGDPQIMRLYGLDVGARLRAAGLRVRVEPFGRGLPEDRRTRHGVLAEDLYLCSAAPKGRLS
jgi:SAM-dependent methyltransferase